MCINYDSCRGKSMAATVDWTKRLNLCKNSNNIECKSDNAEKSTISHTVFMYLKQYLYNINREDLIESTGVVPVKYPSKVKLKFLTTLKCQSWEWIMYTLVSEGFWGFYSNRGLTYLPWFRSLFLIGVLMSVFCGILSF